MASESLEGRDLERSERNHKNKGNLTTNVVQSFMVPSFQTVIILFHASLHRSEIVFFLTTLGGLLKVNLAPSNQHYQSTRICQRSTLL